MADHHPSGSRGPAGKPPLAPNAPPGRPGYTLPPELVPLIEQWDSDDIARFAPVRYLEVVLQSGERSYLNGDFQEAAGKLEWVQNLSKTGAQAEATLTSIVPILAEEDE